MHNIAVQLCEVYTKSEVEHSLMLAPLYVVQLEDNFCSAVNNGATWALSSCAASVQ